MIKCGEKLPRHVGPLFRPDVATALARATVPARAAHAFLAHPTRFERVTFAFRALLLALTPPRRAVAHARPIG
jgi:hypothetical protein